MGSVQIIASTRRFGKVCLKHPELAGERLRSNGTCVKCHNSPAKKHEHYERHKESISAKNNANRSRRRQMVRSLKPTECPVCGKEGKRIDADHCHQTGKPRGWLCLNCNSALGHTADDPALLRKLAEYVEYYQRVHNHKE